MARPKSRIRKALSDAHLKAIGVVAASWSDLELRLVTLIILQSGTSFSKALAMVGGSNVKDSVLITLRLLEADGLAWKIKAFKDLKIESEISRLQGLRNQIIHATWNIPEVNRLFELLAPVEAKAKKLKATGIGFKKNAMQISIPVEFTAAEMRTVAKEIAAVNKSIVEWWQMREPVPRLQQLARGLLDYQSQGQTPAKKKIPKQ